MKSYFRTVPETIHFISTDIFISDVDIEHIEKRLNNKYNERFIVLPAEFHYEGSVNSKRTILVCEDEEGGKK